MIVSFFANIDEENTEYDRENEYFDFKQNVDYKLTVNYWKIDDDKPLKSSNIYCDYELSIPVDFEYGKEMLLEFYCNGLFQLNFIPLSNMWHFFIRDIIGENNHLYDSYFEAIQEKLKVRKGYIDILSKINCDKVILWTDAYYKAEGEVSLPNQTLEDLMHFMRENDKIKFYNFAEVLNKTVEIISDMKNNYFIDIALIDYFNDEIEIVNH